MDRPTRKCCSARRYLEALESGPAGDELPQFFAPEVVLEIFPSKFFPNGARDDLSGILAAAERREKVTTSQKYENQKRGGQRRWGRSRNRLDGRPCRGFSNHSERAPNAGPPRCIPRMQGWQNRFPAQLRLLRAVVGLIRVAAPSIDPTASPPFSFPPSRPRPQPRSSPDTFGHTTGLSLA